MNRCHIMLDLETIGLKPGCPILQIGAVAFTTNLNGVYLTNKFDAAISLPKSESMGFVSDPKTIGWWVEQFNAGNVFARSNSDDALTPDQALESFNEFIIVNGGTDDVLMWANSPSFDCAILKAYYDKLGWDVPWKYYNERDFRTAKALAGVPDDRWPQFTGTKHNALDDAVHQFECLATVLNALYARK